MSFHGFEDFVLTSDSLGLFEELYTYHVGQDVDRLNFAMGKVDVFVKENKTFGQARDLLDIFVNKASEITGDTVLCEDNYTFVWTYISAILTEKRATLGLQAVQEKMKETAKERTMPVSYLLALGHDSAKSIQKSMDEAEAKETAERQERERLRIQKEREKTHPTDPEKRRKLFASRFLKSP